MNNPVQVLYEEHTIITNAIDIAREASALIGKDNAQYESTIRKLITFFREYADGFHHQKEETILFPAIAKKNEMLAEGIIFEMNENHEDFREKVGMIENCLNVEDYPKAQKIMERYTEALLDHIAAENEELFNIATTILDEHELNTMHFQFIDCDRELGDSKKLELVEMASGLRAALMMAE